MKKLVIIGLLGLSSSVFAATNYYLKAGATNYSVDGADSTVATSVRFGMEFNNKNLSSAYVAMEMGAVIGEIENAKIDSATLQYNMGYKTDNFAIYGLFGLESENDIYIDGSYYYGLGMKYNITQNIAIDAEYTTISSASAAVVEPDSSTASLFVSYKL